MTQILTRRTGTLRTFRGSDSALRYFRVCGSNTLLWYRPLGRPPREPKICILTLRQTLLIFRRLLRGSIAVDESNFMSEQKQADTMLHFPTSRKTPVPSRILVFSPSGRRSILERDAAPPSLSCPKQEVSVARLSSFALSATHPTLRRTSTSSVKLNQHISPFVLKVQPLFEPRR